MTGHPVSPNITRPAATLIVLRENGGGAPQILMVQRALTMVFAAGALVFPGGAVDPDDEVLARNLRTEFSIDESAARVAAVRETLEESGLALGLGVSDPEAISALRSDLEDGAAFSSLCQQHGLHLDIDKLIPFARWHPAHSDEVRRVFDTRFYIARHDATGPEPSIDNTEHIDLFWDTAAGVLARCNAGAGHIIYPTRRNLERLAQFDSITAIEAHARATPVEKIVPWMEDRAEGRFQCIPDHLGYPVCSEQIPTATGQ